LVDVVIDLAELGPLQHIVAVVGGPQGTAVGHRVVQPEAVEVVADVVVLPDRLRRGAARYFGRLLHGTVLSREWPSPGPGGSAPLPPDEAGRDRTPAYTTRTAANEQSEPGRVALPPLTGPARASSARQRQEMPNHRYQTVFSAIPCRLPAGVQAMS